MTGDKDSVYRELQEHLDKMPVGYPATKSGVEIAILKRLFSPVEARVAMCLDYMPDPTKRIHKKVVRAIEKLGDSGEAKGLEHLKNIDQLQALLDAMLQKGLLNGGTDTSTGKSMYANAALMMGMFDYQVNRLTAGLMKEVDTYIGEAFLDEYKLSHVPQIRTIPIEQAVTKDNPVATYEDVHHIIDTRSPINVTECVCRKGKQLLGDTCKIGAPMETCFQFGMVAHMYKKLGIGREIGKDEAHKIIKNAETAGLVIQPTNAQKPSTVCCCCGCCCLILTHAKTLAHPSEIFATNHRSSVDASSCTGCGECIERCPLDALSANEGQNNIPTTDPERCIGCGVCVSTCPSDAIHLIKKDGEFIPPADHLELIMKIGIGKGLARKTN